MNRKTVGSGSYITCTKNVRHHIPEFRVRPATVARSASRPTPVWTSGGRQERVPRSTQTEADHNGPRSQRAVRTTEEHRENVDEIQLEARRPDGVTVYGPRQLHRGRK